MVATMNVIWLAPRPSARGTISARIWRAAGSDMSISNESWKRSRTSGQDLHAEMEQRADDHADGQALDAQGGPEQHRAADDGDVVERRRGGRGGETAARVEHGRGHRAERQQRRRDEHDACQAHGQLGAHGVETGREQGHDLRREDGHDRGRQHEREQHQVEHRRHDSPGALLLVHARRGRPGPGSSPSETRPRRPAGRSCRAGGTRRNRRRAACPAPNSLVMTTRRTQPSTRDRKKAPATIMPGACERAGRESTVSVSALASRAVGDAAAPVQRLERGCAR